MKITIRGDKIAITKAMEDYATEKLEKLNKYMENSDSVKANIVAKVIGHNQKVEVTIPLKSFILRAEEEREDFYAAVDVIIDKLESQIRKNKKRMQTRKNKEMKEFVFDYIADDIEYGDPEVIVKRKKIELKPMDEEEAIIQMELLGHQFYLYKDIDTNKPVVVYKRKDGNYGIIESE